MVSADVMNWAETDVEADTGRGVVTWGVGAVGAWTETETCVEG